MLKRDGLLSKPTSCCRGWAEPSIYIYSRTSQIVSQVGALPAGLPLDYHGNTSVPEQHSMSTEYKINEESER